MEKLTARQEDIMLEESRERDYDEKALRIQQLQDNAEHIIKRCMGCNVTDLECGEWAEMDFRGSGEWICGECVSELNDFCRDDY